MTLRVFQHTEDKKYLLSLQKDDREYYNKESWSVALPSTFSTDGAAQSSFYVHGWWTDDFFQYTNANLIAGFSTAQEYEDWIKQHPELQI